MDVWDDEFREPTADERMARRALALAITLTNARRPISTTDLRRDFYPDMKDEAFRKAFRRDCVRLSSAGLDIRRVRTTDTEASWIVNEETSFAHESHLTPEDALVLDCLLSPIAADPSFPFAIDLRIALTQIDRTFDRPAVTSIPPEARVRNNNLTRIENCLLNRHALRLSYTRFDGSETTRIVAPYGLFPLRDTTYMVAARMDEGDEPGEPHTYNLDRVKSVAEQRRTTYVIPSDFDVRDYILLPFQIGEPLYIGEFHVPDNRFLDVRSRVRQGGSFEHSGDDYVLHASVSDEDTAAAWALAEGIVPLQPQGLIDSYRVRVRAVAQGNMVVEGDDRGE